MHINLGTFSIGFFEKLKKKALTKGFKVSNNTIILDFGREDYIFGICIGYEKTKEKIILRALYNPRLPKEKIGELKDEDWEWAKAKARELFA